MILTDKIIEAIESAIQERGELGGLSKLAEESNISISMISRWRNHTPSTKRMVITEGVWKRLEPKIRGYLNKELEEVQSLKIEEKNIIINIVGVPVEKIVSAINKVGLTLEQKKELKHNIFS